MRSPAGLRVLLIAAAFLASNEAAYWPQRSCPCGNSSCLDGEQRCERIDIEIKDGVCTGTTFHSFATCRWNTDGYDTDEQKSAFMSKNYSLSIGECLELTAGKGVAADSLAGAKYLNAAAVCPQIGGTSNATGWCAVGKAGAFCDYLQGAALTTECEEYEFDSSSREIAPQYAGEIPASKCVPTRERDGRKTDNRLCCEGYKRDMNYLLGLAELIWVTPGSEASKWLGNPVLGPVLGVTLPHQWSPLCTGVDEVKFATFKAQLKSSGACSNDPDKCVGIMLWGSVSTDLAVYSIFFIVLALWVVLILINCCGVVCCYFCCGTLERKRRESQMWMDEERQVFQHSMGQAVGNQSAETVVKISHPDGHILGPRVSERWAVFLWVSLSLINLFFATLFGAAFLGSQGYSDAALYFTFLLWIMCLCSCSCVYIQYFVEGCCGGAGIIRVRSALPPVAVWVENEAIGQGRHVEEEAQLLRRPWLQHVFLPVQVNEDLERRPPRRPKGTAKAMIAIGQLPVAGALYVVSFPFGPTFFRLPSGAKAGDTVYVKLPDVFDDGTVWGDNADMYRADMCCPSPPLQTGPPLQSAREQSEITIGPPPPQPLQSGHPGPTQEVINRIEVKDVLNSSDWKTADMSTFDGQRSRVRLISTSGHPPMKVITASQLRCLKRLPRSSEGHAVDLCSLLQRHGREKKERFDFRSCRNKIEETTKPSLAVIMFSHRWFRSDAHQAHPDDAAGHKAMAMVQFADWLMWMQSASSQAEHEPYSLSRLLSNQDADSHMQSREMFLAQTQGNTLTKIDLPSNITEVAFWVDYACVDQDDPSPGIAALPLYVGACPVILCHETDGYEDRAWTRVERVLSLAYSGSSIAMSIKSGFLHRRQVVAKEMRIVSDPQDGSITNERDRPVIEALCNAAVSAAGGQIELGLTEVETRCLVNDDDLHEISIYEAFCNYFFITAPWKLHPVRKVAGVATISRLCSGWNRKNSRRNVDGIELPLLTATAQRGSGGGERGEGGGGEERVH